MAQRRMFSIELLESDSFLDLSNDSKVVYFYLAIRSDDDGFSKCAKAIQRMLGLDDMSFQTALNELEKAQLLYIIDDVFVVRDWKKNNQIQKDRYHSTEFKSILNKLTLKDKIYYLRDVSNMDTECIQHVSNMDTECILSIDKSSKDKSSKDKSSIDEQRQVELREGVGTSLRETIKNLDKKNVLKNSDIEYLASTIQDKNESNYVPLVLKYIDEKTCSYQA